MDRTQIVLLGLPLFLFCFDVLNLFTLRPPPPPPHKAHHHHHHHDHLQNKPPPLPKDTLDFPSQKPIAGAVGVGNTVKISFCTSCSYKGTAVTMTKMLEAAYPGLEVVLSNYPPALPKRLLSKLVPAVQFGIFGIVMGGEQLFPMVGMVPPPWFYSLRANRFGTMASTWLLGNALQSFLQGTGAFEVSLNDELIFSKLQEGRFPGEIELRDAIGRKLVNSGITGDGALWT
ncbi:putative selenoprotein, Rdx type [Rosa chinensis]|uniref:Putative selenoprotein, Rdx type n=1 Tax=Rosa chinensis TaxID=74649 RepID=A0A2P6QK40_ROSCH|nr:selT-like protein [Rosa chinensis]PRQ34536.1 putative selenoprotein, Rdx type [Rosa chinensis]